MHPPSCLTRFDARRIKLLLFKIASLFALRKCVGTCIRARALDYTKGKLCKHCYRVLAHRSQNLCASHSENGTDRKKKKKNFCADALSVVNALTTARSELPSKGLMLQIVESLKAKGCTLNPPHPTLNKVSSSILISILRSRSYRLVE